MHRDSIPIPIVGLFAMVLLALAAVGIISGIVRLMRPHTQAPKQNIFRAIAFGATATVLLLLFLTLFKAGTQTQPKSEAAALTSASVATTRDSAASAVSLHHPGPLENGSESTADSHAPDDTLRHQPFTEDDTLWLPLKKDTLSRLLGDGNAESLSRLTEHFPEGLDEAYALIPLSPTGPNSAPPVIRHVLSPAAMRHLLTPDNVRILSAALTSYLPASSAAGDAEALAEDPLSDQPEVLELPGWVDSPGLGQVVVHSEFLESTTPAEEALRPAILEALQNRITRLSSRQFGTDESWQKLVDVSLSDQAVRQCIVTTHGKVEVIKTIDGPKMMQQTYALIEIPEAVEQQILSTVRSQLITNRTIAVCLTLGAIWLGCVLLMVALRISQHGSLLKKVAAVPVAAIFVLPCMLVAIAMVTAMVNGETFEFGWAGGRVTCMVDKASE